MGPLPTWTAQPPPPSSISDHFLRLLESTEMADVTFRVGPREFPAHTVVLAARSPVFRAMFSGESPPTERGGSGRRLVRIDDTAPAAFEALLHFVYADALPPKVAAAGLAGTRVAGELLAVADRYGMERMWLLFEHAVRDAVVDVATASAALVLADLYRCAELKACCVEYLASSPESLKAMVLTKGYAVLKPSRPVVLLDVFEKAAAGNGLAREEDVDDNY